MKILVYFDEGVGTFTFRQTVVALKEVLPLSYTIQRVGHKYFIENSWESTTALVVFPGGRDSPYHQKLKGEANLRLKNYVKNGGKFLGICAGAYYASSFIEFEKGGALEIIEKRELGFFPGKAIGPAYGNGSFEYGNDKGAKSASLSWQGEIFSAFYNGGCWFENAENTPGVEVIAHYKDIKNLPAAVIKCQSGKGMAVLSGIHPEYNCLTLNSHAKGSMQQIFSDLLPFKNIIKKFWKYLLLDRLLSNSNY